MAMLDGLKEAVRAFKLFSNLELAMADILEDHEKRLSALEESHAKQKDLHTALHTRVIEQETILGDHLRKGGK